MNGVVIFYFGSLLLTALTALAEEPNTLSLHQVVTAVRADNAQLRALDQKAGAMGERSRQAGSLANPMLTYRGMDSASGGRWPNTDEKRAEIEQAFPWPGKRGLTQTIAMKDADAMTSGAGVMRLDVEMQAAETFYALNAVRRSLVILQQEEALLRRIEELATLRYATGAVGQQDVLKTQTEITMLKQKRVELEARERMLENKLNTLMSRPFDAVIGPLIVLPPRAISLEKIEGLAAKALSRRPELQQAQAQLERAQAERALMQKEGLPDYKLGLEYRSMPGEDQAMFMVGVELPLWRSKIGAGRRGAEQMILSEQAAREATERQVRQDVQDALTQLRATQQTLSLTAKELIPQAELRYSASEAAYRSGGKGDFMDLLESQRFLLNARVMGVMAEGEWGMQWARLARAVGVNVLEIEALAEADTGAIK